MPARVRRQAGTGRRAGVEISLKKIRPSNLVLLAAAPFIVFLFASSSKYLRSLKAIIGIEPGALGMLTGFALVAALPATGFLAARRWMLGDAAPRWLVLLAQLALPIHALLILAILLVPSLPDPFIQSVFFHSLDPADSALVDRGARPWTLKPEVLPLISEWFRIGLALYGVVFLAFTLAVRRAAGKVRQRCIQGFQAVTGTSLFYLLFICHWGFATGIAVTFRAAVFAYLLAAILGLIWTGLQSFRPTRMTTPVYGAISVLLLATAALFWSQPRVEYVMVGSTEARIAIVKGTPQAVTDVIRFGEYEGSDGTQLRIRSAPDVATALDQIETIASVSGAFVPVAAHDGTYPEIWRTRFLPDGARTPAMAFSAVGLLLLILTCGGALHRLHPLAVGSEFFVDTIRGIPMLVIILYIGLPLSGAIKDATGGGIDMTNFTRGVIAISVGYSAYMAEIFRAGIEAVPTGQVEAGKSLGLSRWKSARLIILPQAVRIVVPPLGNEFIAMIKDTSLLSILSVRDVTQRMREFQSASFLPFAPFNTAAVLYVVITLACASFLKWIERRYERRQT